MNIVFMQIKVTPSQIPDVLIIEPTVFDDDRGFFFESFNQREINIALGQAVTFVQDNHSKSQKGTLRGLHYQTKNTQSKLVRVILGVVYDVVVDLRQSSKTFGHWMGLELSAINKKQLWIPAGFAHGSLAISNQAELLYKTTDYYDPLSEQSLLWSDNTLAINWPKLDIRFLIAKKDQDGLSWSEAPKF